jgi:hypothetical protein
MFIYGTISVQKLLTFCLVALQQSSATLLQATFGSSLS